jgi:hypothetical protein
MASRIFLPLNRKLYGGPDPDFNTPPRAPHAANLEVKDKAAGAIPSGWTVLGNSGSTPTLQTLAGLFNNAGPNTNSHDINGDGCRGRWLFTTAGAKVIHAYRAFAPASGTKWCAVVKVAYAAWSTLSTDDRITFYLSKIVPTTSDGDLTADCVVFEWRPAIPDLRSFTVTAGTGSALTSGGAQINPALAVSPLYLAFTCETDNSIILWASRDGAAWHKLQRYTTGSIIGNVNYAGVSLNDASGGADFTAGFEFVRFLEGDNNLWKLGFGS